MKSVKKIITAALAAGMIATSISQTALAANVIIAYQTTGVGPGGAVAAAVQQTQNTTNEAAVETTTEEAASSVIGPGGTASSGTRVIGGPQVVNDWRMIDGKWYRYGEDGSILTGWQDIGGKIYYLSEADAEGHPLGSLYVSEKTPDGRSVDENGELDQIGNPDTDYIEKANPYGSQTCVEINLSEQRVYVYNGALLVLSSPCVTGNVQGGHATPAGDYKIYSREKDRILRGTNDNGTKYASHVDYWMPFNGGIGLHDADWRNVFGGQIYVSGGSHGCVNMPADKAAKLYGMSYVGMPVHVHN